jgi:hypothetical protein
MAGSLGGSQTIAKTWVRYPESTGVSNPERARPRSGSYGQKALLAEPQREANVRGRRSGGMKIAPLGQSLWWKTRGGGGQSPGFSSPLRKVMWVTKFLCGGLGGG